MKGDKGMKAKHLLLGKIYRALIVLALIAMLLISTSARAEGGTLDPTFGTGGVVVADLGSSSDRGIDIALQPDGKIVVLGSAGVEGSDPPARTSTLTRYNPDGTLDPTFGINGKVAVDGDTARVVLQPGGKLIVVSRSFRLVRYTNSGTWDSTFDVNGVSEAAYTENGSIHFQDLAVQPDGKIVLVGTWSTYGHHYPSVIAGLNENGTLDQDFGRIFYEFQDGLQHSPQGVAFQSNGRILMSGDMITEEGDGQIILGRFTTGYDAYIDPTFGTNGEVLIPLDNFQHSPDAIAVQADDKIVIAGTDLGHDGLDDNLVLARYNSNGAPDPTLGGSGLIITDLGRNEVANDVAVQRDGKIILVVASINAEAADTLLMRYNLDGSIDTSFGDAGKVTRELGGNYDSLARIALQPDGKILAVGAKGGDLFLARYGGTLPPTTTLTFKSKAPPDGWMLESSEFSNAAGLLEKNATTFNVGDNQQDRQYRSILSFNTVSLPDNAYLVSAQVNIKRQGLVGTDPFTTHGNLLLEIRNGLFSNDLDLTLNDFAAPASSVTAETFTTSTYVWYTANLGSSNLGLVNKYGITQFRLRFDLDDNDDLSSDYLKFFSGDATYEADYPQLIVTYIVP
jgi:uncharacterized delta-60 repeat protein